MEKMKISLPIIVEGRYDKCALAGYIDAVIVTTGGFSVFNNKEKQLLIKKLGTGITSMAAPFWDNSKKWVLQLIGTDIALQWTK